MIGNSSWYTLRITRSLHQSPFVVALDGVACGRCKLFRIDFAKALQIEFEERVEAAFTDIQTSKHKKLLVKDEA